MTTSYPTVLFPRPPDGVTCFCSGASSPSDLRGLSRFLISAGVSLPELSAPVLEELLGLGHLPWSIFVDTGAFSEVEADETGRFAVVAPIDETAWHERLGVSLRIARAFGPKAYVVAPDRVGDQGETLARLCRHRAEVHAIRATGARVVVPLQRGALSTAAFELGAIDALGFSDFVRGIPGNKDAMPTAELGRYLREARPRAVHLLGVGPRNPRLPALHALCQRLVPGAALSCDSNQLAALVGCSNGKGGGPRPLTAAQAMFAADGSEQPREDAVAWTLGVSAILWRFQRELERVGLARRPPPAQVQLGLYDATDTRSEATT